MAQGICMCVNPMPNCTACTNPPRGNAQTPDWLKKGWTDPPWAIPAVTRPRLGWECPKCGHTYSPVIPECYNCNKAKV